MKKLFLATLISAVLPSLALADQASVEIAIKNHQFTPSEVRIPANTRIKLIVMNQDSTPEEFEGKDFDLEKIIPGNSKARILVGPFKPGRYKFVGEFHEDSAKGVLIAE